LNNEYNDYLFNVRKEDIEWLSNQLVDLFMSNDFNETVSNVTNELFSNAIPIDQIDIVELVEHAITSIGGITDPITQLKQWISNVLSSVASWIVNNLWGLIKPALDEIAKAIQSFFNQIIDSISQISNTITSVIWGAIHWLADQLNKIVITPIENAVKFIAENLPNLVNMIQSAFKTIADYVSNIPNMIIQGIENVITWIKDNLGKVASLISNAVSTISDFISKIPSMIQQGIEWAITNITKTLSSIPTIIENALSKVVSFIESIPSSIQNVISTLIDYIKSGFASLSDEARRVIESIIKSITDALGKVPKLIDNVLKGLEGLGQQINNIYNALTTTISDVKNALESMIKDIPSTITKALQEVVSSIEKQFKDFLKTLTSDLTKIFDTIKSNIQGLVSSFTEQLNKALSSIQSAINNIVSAISKIPDELNNLFKTITSKLEGIVKWFEDTLKSMIENAPAIIEKSVENVEQWIFEKLPSYVRQFFQEAPKALQQVGVALTGFTNAILKFPEWFPQWFQQFITTPLTTVIKELFGPLPPFIERIIDMIDEANRLFNLLITDPLKFYEDVILKPTINALGKIVKRLLDFFTEIEDEVYKVSKWLTNKTQFIIKPISTMFQAMLNAVIENYNKLIQGKMTISEFITSYFKAIIPTTLEIASILGAMRFIGEEINSFIGRIHSLMSALPFLGMTIELVAEGEIFETIADVIEKGAWGIAYNVPFSVAFWLASPIEKPIEYAFRYQLRNILPFALPTTTQIRDIIRRLFAKATIEPTWGKEFVKLYDRLLQFFALRGYSDDVAKLLFDPGVIYYTHITDRFGGKRIIPLSLLWDLPSRSDLVRMLQRDVFQSPMEWANFIKVHGLNQDLGKMYYMMSFEYPSFEKLWTFFVRGISGMLWYEPPDFIKNWFTQDAKWLGAGIPVEPKKLNYDYNALFKAIPFYLKWIQKSNFSWFRKGAIIQYGNATIPIDFDWTADSWMLWDIAADLPGKIDARWMAKWALFDLISEKVNVPIPSVGQSPKPYPETPFVDMVSQVVENVVESEIYMDLRAFCRLLVANGIHPAFVPITAVSETINALSDERTLLRTGFINLFKEGFWNYTTIDTLLNGFFVASFIVEYFDPTDKKWKAGAINAPIKFLPAERRLLELRAAMDRALDILRDLVKELNRSYAEYIVTTKDEYIAILKDGINITNAWFKPLIKDLTGKELELQADMDYWSSYAKVIDIMQNIYKIRRVRYWIGRLLTWTFYRLAYSYVTPDDVKRILDVMKDRAHLTPLEVETLQEIMNLINGIVRKEYIPTPSQLATIVEIVPEAINYMNEVFEQRNVPVEWRPIWAKYIEAKPIRDDVRSLLTDYRKAKLYHVQLGEIEKTILELAKQVGYTDRELQILFLRIQLDELIDEAKTLRKEYLPTPLGLATLSEYITIPPKLVLEVLSKRGVPKEWLNLWIKYIQVKPLYDDVKALAYAYFKALRYGVPLDGYGKEIEKLMKEFGWTPQEIYVRKLRATIEAMIDQWKEIQKEYIPTPSMIATIAEIVPEVRKLAYEVFEKRHVPKEWIPIWSKYIALKPLIDEVKKYVGIVIEMYEYFAITYDELKKALERVKPFGYEDQEIKLILYNSDLLASYRAYKELIGTPKSLVVMAEYSPSARNLALAQVYKMIDKLPVDNATKEFIKKMWEEYIRVKPVYDEVKRYITELINDYAHGVITRDEFIHELNELKKWGVDDYEIQFYVWLADRRKMRYSRTRRSYR